jgi:NitT/TauT family transport system substrate-binding protein
MSIKDFGANDKIAVPSIKISTGHHVTDGREQGLRRQGLCQPRPVTVSLSHPDATLAFTNNTAGVNAHFMSSPFYEQEIKVPGAHLVTTNYEILGGPATAVLITASGKFRDANPKAYKAFLEALTEAIGLAHGHLLEVRAEAHHDPLRGHFAARPEAAARLRM